MNSTTHMFKNTTPLDVPLKGPFHGSVWLKPATLILVKDLVTVGIEAGENLHEALLEGLRQLPVLHEPHERLFSWLFLWSLLLPHGAPGGCLRTRNVQTVHLVPLTDVSCFFSVAGYISGSNES